MRLKWCRKGGSTRVTQWVWERFEMGKTMNSQKCLRENWKCLKTDLFAQNTRFSRLSQVACNSPGLAARTLKRKLLKKISKCFSRLEVPLARELRTEPRKSLCTPHGRTFHLQTSRQPEPQKAWNSKILKNILSLFCDWSIYPPMSRQWVVKNLCMDSQLRHATGSTRN